MHLGFNSLTRGCDVLDGISLLGHPEEDHGEGDFDGAVEVALEEGEQDDDEYGSMEGLMIA